MTLPSKPESVPRTHSSCRSKHTTRGGVKFVVALLLARILGWTTGCGPKDGEIGGKCKDTGSCHAICDEGVCDNATDTCVASTESSTGGQAECVQLGGATCGAGKIGLRCEADADTSPYAASCAAVPAASDGVTTNYCCDDPAQGTCTAADASLCPSSMTSSDCTGLTTPASDAGGSIGCFANRMTGHVTEYCCAAPGACISFPDDSGLSICGSAIGVYCVGNVAPPDGCWSQGNRGVPGGAVVSFYCCDEADAQ